MQITWTNCAEQMPPYTDDEFIFKDEWGYWSMYICKGNDYITGNRALDRVSYTPYTPEKWEDLPCPDGNKGGYQISLLNGRHYFSNFHDAQKVANAFDKILSENTK